MKAVSGKSKRSDVLSYTELISLIAQDTGLPKSQVRSVLEASQRMVAGFLKKNVGGRARFGRLVTFESRMTKEREVNHPQKPGEKVLSSAHVVLRTSAGSHAKAFLNGKRPTWDAGPQEEF